jgi:gamma-glutamyltranspeptidase/glutathione hydrolase
MPVFGPYSVVIPGHVAGLHTLHKKCGRLEFGKLLSDAIRLAEEGFPIHAALCRAIELHWNALSVSARSVFAPRGEVPTPGEILKQEALAKTLRTIADKGAEGFYDGWLGDAVSRKITQESYAVSSDDFRDFKPEWCEPLIANYKDTRVYEIPPNSMGATTLLILKHLETLNLKRMKPNSKERIASTLKCVKEAYARKDEELGDPRFVDFDLQKFLTTKSKSKSSQRLRKSDGDTTYFAIVDDQGNILSGIQSIFHNFGSKIFVDDGGFFLNNRASSFKFNGPNKLEPRKRPIHTLSSMLLENNGAIKIGLGCSGGEYRPQQHALFVTNIVDYSMSLEEALSFPRFLWESGKVIVEKGFDKIGSSGYDVELLDYPAKTGVAQGVEVLKGAKKAVCDVRGDGIPLGL